MRVFRGHLAFVFVEFGTVDRMFGLAVVRIVDDGEQRPEGGLRLLADEPGRGHAAEPGYALLEATQPQPLVRIVRVDLAQNVLITVGRLDRLPVGTMNFQHRFNYLKFENALKSRNRTNKIIATHLQIERIG